MSTYIIRDDAGGEETIKGTLAEARARAREIYAPDNYSLLSGGPPEPTNETCWWHVSITADGEGAAGGGHYPIHPPEPECDSDKGIHEWVAPHAIVGGIRENPGCWGHGGGVMTDEVCLACGWTKHEDTWAQCRDCGTQGLRSVRYSREHAEAIKARTGHARDEEA